MLAWSTIIQLGTCNHHRLYPLLTLESVEGLSLLKLCCEESFDIESAGPDVANALSIYAI
jgi:hypothetical protein